MVNEMVNETDAGRVQGGGFYYSTSASTTSIPTSTVDVEDISPIIGDIIINANGDLCKITAISDTAYTVEKKSSIKGPAGNDGKNAEDFSDVKFATSDWERIMDVIAAGRAAEIFKLTDKRKISFGNGKSLELSILDLSGRHDVMSSDESTPAPCGFAPITLGIVMTTGDYYPYEPSGASSDWENSPLRNETMPALMDMLPDEIKKYIVPVIKYTQKGGGDSAIIKTVEKCFPFSLVEITGNCTTRIVADGNLEEEGYASEPYTLEGEQYDYFKAVQDGETGEGRILYDPSGSTDYYWTRTPYAGDSNFALYVRNVGDVGYGLVFVGDGVPFGFCVSK